MTQLCAEQLRAARINGNFGLLNEQAIVIVKEILGRFFRGGLPRKYNSPDLYQESMLAAFKAIRAWEPDRGNLFGYLQTKVGGAVRNFMQRERGGLVGGRDTRTSTAALVDDVMPSNFLDAPTLIEEDEKDARITALWMRLPDDTERLLVRDHFGLCLPGEAPRDAHNLDQLAIVHNMPRRTVARKLKRAISLLKKWHYFSTARDT